MELERIDTRADTFLSQIFLLFYLSVNCDAVPMLRIKRQVMEHVEKGTAHFVNSHDLTLATLVYIVFVRLYSLVISLFPVTFRLLSFRSVRLVLAIFAFYFYFTCQAPVIPSFLF